MDAFCRWHSIVQLSFDLLTIRSNTNTKAFIYWCNFSCDGVVALIYYHWNESTFQFSNTLLFNLLVWAMFIFKWFQTTKVSKYPQCYQSRQWNSAFVYELTQSLIHQQWNRTKESQTSRIQQIIFFFVECVFFSSLSVTSASHIYFLCLVFPLLSFYKSFLLRNFITYIWIVLFEFPNSLNG